MTTMNLVFLQDLGHFSDFKVTSDNFGGALKLYLAVDDFHFLSLICLTSPYIELYIKRNTWKLILNKSSISVIILGSLFAILYTALGFFGTTFHHSHRPDLIEMLRTNSLENQKTGQAFC